MNHGPALHQQQAATQPPPYQPPTPNTPAQYPNPPNSPTDIQPKPPIYPPPPLPPNKKSFPTKFAIRVTAPKGPRAVMSSRQTKLRPVLEALIISERERMRCLIQACSDECAASGKRKNLEISDSTN
nr:uncharacterized proline-rich protein-like [Penaeus vannamei]